MPSSQAQLRRVRCRAASKRSGERCRRFCAPGFVVCKWHGGGSPQAQRSAERRELVAELVSAGPGSVPAGPRRTSAQIVADAVALADLQLQDATAARTAEQAETAIRLVHGAVRLAHDLGVEVGPSAGERAAEEVGALVAGVVGKLGRAMLTSLRSPSSDYLELEAWLVSQVPALLRSPDADPVPCPTPWRLVNASAPMLEAVATVRARWEAEAREAMRGAAGAASRPSGRSDAGGDVNGAQGDAAEAVAAESAGPRPATTAVEWSERLHAEMRSGPAPAPVRWRGGS